MSVNLQEITALSRRVASEQGRGLDVVSVTTGGDSERVEITVDIGGCHREPCRFVVNVSRADTEQFDRDFRAQLTDVLEKHASDVR